MSEKLSEFSAYLKISPPSGGVWGAVLPWVSTWFYRCLYLFDRSEQRCNTMYFMSWHKNNNYNLKHYLGGKCFKMTTNQFQASHAAIFLDLQMMISWMTRLGTVLGHQVGKY